MPQKGGTQIESNSPESPKEREIRGYNIFILGRGDMPRGYRRRKVPFFTRRRKHEITEFA